MSETPASDAQGARHGPQPGDTADGAAREGAAGIATALAEISERATLLIHEEIELAKAEVTQKVTKLARGAVVSAVAGVFIVTAVLFALVGCAWLLYYYLPVGSSFTYFWGFFAMAVILLVLGVLAGLIAARFFRASAPPVPNMAIEEARRIRETVSNGSDGVGGGPAAQERAAAPPPAVAPVPPPAPAPPPPPTPPPAPPPPRPTIDEAALQADPTVDASKTPTDELGPPVEEPGAGDDMEGAS